MKNILYISMALIGLAVLVPAYRTAVHMVTGESAALSQFDAATTPAALRAQGGDEKVMAAANQILAAAGGQPVTQHTTPTAAQSRWVSLDTYEARQ